MNHRERSAILYQSVDREITLIDIPTSIAIAQGRSDTLLSTPPLEEPIQPKEEYQPKTKKATEPTWTETAHHEIYKPLIQQALLDIGAHVSGPWCAPRHVLPHSPGDSKTATRTVPTEKELEHHFREWTASKENQSDGPSDFERMMASLGAPEAQPAPVESHAHWTMNYSSTDTTPITTALTPALHNPSLHPLQLTISRTAPTPPHNTHTFTLPPLSSYFLSNCDTPDTFRTPFRSLTATHSLPRHFDLVLLDPPWPNRSAKRKAAYEQIGGMPYLTKLLLRMDLDDYLAPNALVGIWITNKPALREHVLGPGGLFERWNVGLVEEWVWVKVTRWGEPMFDIDDAMRKPYEVLLLGRAAESPWVHAESVEKPRRRMVAAVPDVHSRKPCLKELLREYLPRGGEDCGVLEVFARYLVEGWMAWGNEVLKYNADIYWNEESKESPRSAL